MEKEKLLKFIQEKKIVYIILIAVVIAAILFIIVAVKLIKDNNRCVSNPFTYSVDRIIITATNPIQDPLCLCDMGIAGSFYFDKEGIYKENPRLSGWKE